MSERYENAANRILGSINLWKEHSWRVSVLAGKLRETVEEAISEATPSILDEGRRLGRHEVAHEMNRKALHKDGSKLLEQGADLMLEEPEGMTQAVAEALVLKYNADQPRDAQGRWTSEGDSMAAENEAARDRLRRATAAQTETQRLGESLANYLSVRMSLGIVIAQERIRGRIEGIDRAGRPIMARSPAERVATGIDRAHETFTRLVSAMAAVPALRDPVNTGNQQQREQRRREWREYFYNTLRWSVYYHSGGDAIGTIGDILSDVGSGTADAAAPPPVRPQWMPESAETTIRDSQAHRELVSHLRALRSVITQNQGQPGIRPWNWREIADAIFPRTQLGTLATPNDAPR